MCYNELDAQSSTIAPPAEESSWPTVWGILGCVWGAVVILLSGCVSLFVFVWPGMQAKMIQADPRPMPGIVMIVALVDMLVSIVLAGLLISGCIALAKRRPVARKRINLFIGARVAMAPIFLALALLMQRPMWEHNRDFMRDFVAFMEKNQGAKSVTQQMRDAANETEPGMTGTLFPALFACLGLIPPAVYFVVVNGKSRRAEIESWQA